MGIRPAGWVLAAILALAISQAPDARATQLPAGVPDLLDPAVQAQFRVVLEERFGGDPDFPALALVNVTDHSPRIVLLIIDARNGKATWSLREDAAVFLVISDSPISRHTFLDRGFAASGRASGSYLSGGVAETDDLLRALQESHRRHSRRNRMLPASRPTPEPGSFRWAAADPAAPTRKPRAPGAPAVKEQVGSSPGEFRRTRLSEPRAEE